MSITQKDIARMLGVTQATVSRALKGSPHVSETLRSRIAELCSNLDYQPDYNASSLSGRETKVISILNTEMLLTDLLSHWVTSLQNKAREFGYKSRMEYVGDIRRIIQERSADGFVILGGPEALGRHFPTFSPDMENPIIYTDCESLESNCVSIDNMGGTGAAVRHLADLGHRRMAYFGLISRSGTCRERYMGFVRQLNDLGLNAPSTSVIGQSHWPTEVDDALKCEEQLLAAVESGVTGIVASSDINAVGAIKILKRHGYGVPRDISVVGFDDTLLARAWDPAITTVRQDVVAASGAAVQMVIQAIRERTPVPSITMDAPLIVRKTTGPCAGA